MSFRSFCRLSKQGRWSKGPFALNEGRYNFVLLGQTSYLFSIACCVLCTLVLYALYLILCLCPVISHTVPPPPPSKSLDYSIRLRMCVSVSWNTPSATNSSTYPRVCRHLLSQCNKLRTALFLFSCFAYNIWAGSVFCVLNVLVMHFTRRNKSCYVWTTVT